MIFVIGNSRSGTTMMGRVLGNHHEIFTFHELHFFEGLWSLKDKNLSLSQKECINLYAKLLSRQREGFLNPNKDFSKFKGEASRDLDGKKYNKKHEIFRYFLEKESIKSGKGIPCEQTPRNLFYIEEIINFFPDAKIINMVRDPRDILLSQKNKWRRRAMGEKNFPLIEVFRSWVNYHPFTISKLWEANIKHVRKFKNSSSILTIKFEELLDNPESEIRKICDFLEVSFSFEMLNITQVGSSHARDNEVLKGINPKRKDLFRKGGLEAEELFLCQKLTQENLSSLGYSLFNIKFKRWKLMILYLTFPLKLFAAFMLNLKRSNNIFESIKRRLA